MEKKVTIYDLIIIGGGPAGVTAAIYATRANLSVLLIEKDKIGGQVGETFEILNYTGFEKITGKELAQNMSTHLKSTAAKIVYDEVQDTVLEGETKKVKCYKQNYEAYAVIIAVGTAVRSLDVAGQNNFIGRGISYSALGDREKYEGKTVAVVGGGNTALEECLYLAEKAKKVLLIHRRDRYRGSESLVKRMEAKTNIGHISSSKIIALSGKDKLEKLTVENLMTGEKKDVSLDCLFVAIGRGANVDFIDSRLMKTEDGFIKGNKKMETSIEGVYVAGDIRDTELRQIVSATSDGAVAATSAYNYLMKKRGKSYE